MTGMCGCRKHPGLVEGLRAERASEKVKAASVSLWQQLAPAAPAVRSQESHGAHTPAALTAAAATFTFSFGDSP